ncbi:MAG: QacE family quaternary ammonium compound efflux SMR transporter, partial [Candidatus Methanomethylophilaceae archaeon]|nr:QacE family quaternary ammonium compound efflux SMR transporter [Candidatus Methanomethylophilaceae archaeon]
MSSSWIWVLIGGLFETVWAVFMKMSDGFTDPLYTALTIIFLFVSVALLNMGLKRGLPVGPSYAVWVGIGAVMSVISGIVLFGESLS